VYKLTSLRITIFLQLIICVVESSLVGFGGLDDKPIKGLTSVISVEQVLNAKLTGFYILDITSKMDIAQVRLMCVARRQLIKPRMEARRASRYRVHGRRSKWLRNPKPMVKKKTCKVKVDRVKKSYGTSRTTT
jgi:hypothetical protein